MLFVKKDDEATAGTRVILQRSPQCPFRQCSRCTCTRSLQKLVYASNVLIRRVVDESHDQLAKLVVRFASFEICAGCHDASFESRHDAVVIGTGDDGMFRHARCTGALYHDDVSVGARARRGAP